MRFKLFIPLLTLIPLTVFSQPDNARAILHSPISSPKFTIEQFKSNESDLNMISKKSKRTIDVPTQIIRTTGDLTGQNLSCDEVTQFIDEKVLHPFQEEDFTYNTLVSCSYDPSTEFATGFSINTYFDPLSDEAVAFLQKYLTEVNGSDIFGTTLHIESAKGLIIAINLMAGTIKNPDKPPFMLFGQERSNFSFKSNYEMKNVFLTDVYANFYSDDRDKILPFLNRWIYPGVEYYFLRVLWDSNYVELQPERIFVMDNNGDIFVSRLRYYFAHQCYKHDHHFCIKRS